MLIAEARGALFVERYQVMAPCCTDLDGKSWEIATKALKDVAIGLGFTDLGLYLDALFIERERIFQRLRGKITWWEYLWLRRERFSGKRN